MYLKRGVGDTVGIEAMCSALDAIRQFVNERPRDGKVLQILNSGAASPSSEFPDTARAIHKRQQSDVAEWVRQGQASGEIRGDVDARGSCENLRGLYHRNNVSVADQPGHIRHFEDQ